MLQTMPDFYFSYPSIHSFISHLLSLSPGLMKKMIRLPVHLAFSSPFLNFILQLKHMAIAVNHFQRGRENDHERKLFLVPNSPK